MNWETLLAFGDSITFGARSYLGYPEICADVLGKRMDKDWHVVNHSTNGLTTMGLLRSIDPHLSNYKSIYPSLITVMIGTNDIKTRVKAEEFRIAYRQLVVKLRLLAVNNNIVLLRIPRLTQKVFYPYHYSMNEEIIKFNDVIREAAEEHGLRTFGFDFADEDFFDGVHLNSRGCYSAAGQLANLILKDKGLEGSPGLP
jgi:lysophospholipase L1-like esterase